MLQVRATEVGATRTSRVPGAFVCRVRAATIEHADKNFTQFP
jgi:hypothetical protein